jgi:signal transduction histidine kinase
MWRIHLNKGDFASARSAMQDTMKLCRQSNEKHFRVTTMAAQCLLSYLCDNELDISLLKATDELTATTTAFLTHSHVGCYLVEIFLLCDDYAEAFRRIKPILTSVRQKSVNSEYTTPHLVHYLQILLHDASLKPDEPTVTGFSPIKRAIEFTSHLLQLRFACISYPAYRGFYHRIVAQRKALSRNLKSAHDHYQKSLSHFNTLSMRYEEARSHRDYALFLHESCHNSTESRNHYNEAYRLFAACGAKFETTRIASKVDPALTRPASAALRPPSDIASSSHGSDSAYPSVSLETRISTLRFQSLLHLSSSLTAINDVDALFKQILGASITITGARWAVVLVDEGENRPQRAVGLDYTGAEVPLSSITLDDALIEKVRTTRTMALSQDEAAGRGSILVLPLARGTSYLGCAYLANERIAGLFSDDSVKAGLVLAAQAGILLENAFLIESYRLLNQSLEQKVTDQLRDISLVNERLRNSERMKGLLTGTLVHDIKNHIFSIASSLKTLENAHVDAEGAEAVASAQASCSSATSLAANMLDIGKMEEGRLVVSPERLDAQQVCRILSQYTTSRLFDERGIQVDCAVPQEGAFALCADKYLLDRVVQNLLMNAVLYTPERGRVEISLQSPGTIRIFNSGTPIPTKYRENIFDKYAQISTDRSRYTHGLGLFFCKMVMNAHGGSIELECTDQGNCFVLRFEGIGG